jgi:hypothetical protein
VARIAQTAPGPFRPQGRHVAVPVRPEGRNAPASVLLPGHPGGMSEAVRRARTLPRAAPELLSYGGIPPGKIDSRGIATAKKYANTFAFAR